MDAFVAADFAWPVDGSGLHLGWGRLKLRPADLARIGQLMLDEGKWKGEQVVPADWVRASTTEQVDTIGRRNQAERRRAGSATSGGSPRPTTNRPTSPGARGGQLLEVVPSRSLVVVVASEIDYGRPRSAGFSANVLTFLVDHVIAPAVAP